MNREKLVPFALGFAAGVLLMLLVGGGVGGLAGWALYQQAQAQRERAAAAEQKAQDEAEARQRSLADLERANEDLKEAHRRLLERPLPAQF